MWKRQNQAIWTHLEVGWVSVRWWLLQMRLSQQDKHFASTSGQPELLSHLGCAFHFVSYLSPGQIWTHDESWLHLKLEVKLLLLFSLSAELCSVQNARLVHRWCDARHPCIPLPGLKRSAERTTLTCHQHLNLFKGGHLFKDWLITILPYFLYEYGQKLMKFWLCRYIYRYTVIHYFQTEESYEMRSK